MLPNLFGLLSRRALYVADFTQKADKNVDKERGWETTGFAIQNSSRNRSTPKSGSNAFDSYKVLTGFYSLVKNPSCALTPQGERVI